MEPTYSNISSILPKEVELLILSKTNLKTLGRFSQVSKECKTTAECNYLWKLTFPLFNQLEISNLKDYIYENKMIPLYDFEILDSIDEIQVALDKFIEMYSDVKNKKFCCFFSLNKNSRLEWSYTWRNEDSSNFFTINYLFSKDITNNRSEFSSTRLPDSRSLSFNPRVSQIDFYLPHTVKSEYKDEISKVMDSLKL